MLPQVNIQRKIHNRLCRAFKVGFVLERDAFRLNQNARSNDLI